MAGEQQQQGGKKIGFKTIVLFKDQTLGIGSYGSVCMAKCDDLLCAAKIIHPTLFDPTALHQIAPHREHRLPIRRFQLECEFLSTVRHPNVVQYLGTHQDPETHLPVLLMELMDDSLTYFLGSSPQPIPYHIQVNICHDISRALSFLHSNGIVHRDLSSNNVLLIGNIRAKLTDFGMARLGDLNPQATRFTNTMCPGTDVYMPPEAVQDKPVYTEKIDCFSFGVIAVQTLTQEFPKPGDRMKIFDDPRFPRGALKLCVPEIERRQNHIGLVYPNHPLLPIALDCLKDADGERPSAQQLCERLAALKETAKYKNASERVKDSRGKEREYEQFRHVVDQKDATIAEKEQQLRQCREELTQQIQQQNQQILQQRQQIQIQNQETRQLERAKQQAIQEKERELGRVNQQLEESERLIADFGKQNAGLEEELRVLRSQVQGKDGGAKAGAVSRSDFKLRWREGKRVPCVMSRYSDAVVHNSVVYCKYDSDDKVYAYHISSSSWSLTPDVPYNAFALAVIDGLLTTVGGLNSGENTNKLLSLTGEGSGRRWTEKFPPMPTKRCGVSVLCTGTNLIVAGGFDVHVQTLKTVEVLNTETQEWHTAADLPQPLSYSSITLCNDLVYLLGGEDQKEAATNSVHSCSLSSFLWASAASKSLRGHLVSTLTRSSRKGSPWNRVADLPVKLSTAVSLHDRLLAIGGRDSKDEPTTAVHMYQPTTNSWEVISHMTTPRSDCLSTILPDNVHQLMVVGGWTTTGNRCDSLEFGIVV